MANRHDEPRFIGPQLPAEVQISRDLANVSAATVQLIRELADVSDENAAQFGY